MTRLWNDPSRFTDDMVAGFVDANHHYVTAVPGGVVRATETPAAKVAVVVGGGSGHYPAFCGVVGSGFADGAVIGNVFTSPSAADAASVGRAAHSDAGVLFLTGNYAGDVMNFRLAVELLKEEGIDARYLVVTDDIASAPADAMERRRGIAGDFVVFKVAAAAAETGLDLDAVERVAAKANERTRTLGVAFDGCTLPGATEPLFTVAPGQMGTGLGIHGEPGIGEERLPTASELARLLVDSVVADRLDVLGSRVAVVLNGLGRTKYEELFVVWADVVGRLREHGLDVVDPEVGELVTSLDMAGCSLTVTWLDEELERLWTAPADTPAYRKRVIEPTEPTAQRRRSATGDATTTAGADDGVVSHGPPQPCSERVLTALEAMAGAVAEQEAELGRLDSVAGDGDHGRGMVRGTAAAVDAARRAVAVGDDPGAVLIGGGAAWAEQAGGTSGALWGAGLIACGRALGDVAPESDRLVAGVRAAYAEMVRLGGANLGDKTLLDALGPFSDTLAHSVAAGATLHAAWAAAADAAEAAAAATADMRPRIGRAQPLADRSVGSPDPGATSLALCVKAVASALEGIGDDEQPAPSQRSDG